MTEEIINETNIMQLWRKHLDDSSTMEVKEWMARRDMLLEIRERYFPSEYPVEPEPEPEPKVQVPEEENKNEFVVTPPPIVIQCIKARFTLENGKVYEKGKLVTGAKQVHPDTKNRYPIQYIEAVLRNKLPDLSFLFVRRDGELYRSDDAFWPPMHKGTVVKSANVCGVQFTGSASPNSSNTERRYSGSIEDITVEGSKVCLKGVPGEIFKFGNKVYSAQYFLHKISGVPYEIPHNLFYLVNGVVYRNEEKAWTRAWMLRAPTKKVSIDDQVIYVSDIKPTRELTEKQLLNLQNQYGIKV